ncbi:MAG: malonyl-CoA synthase [Bauldia sp.]
METMTTSANLFDLFDKAVTDRTRLLIETPDGRRLTYGDLAALSARLAHALVARGVVPGDRVAVQVEKSVEAVALYLACLRASAVYLPLNTAYTLAELAYFIEDAEPKVIVCDPARSEAVAALAARQRATVETLDATGAGSLIDLADGRATAFATVHCWPGDLAAILYTSGTTGRPKGAMLSHENLAANARTLVEVWRFTSRDVLLHALPIYHTHGLFVAINTVLLSGGSMVVLPKFDTGEIFRLLPRATVLMGVSTFYTRLLADPRLTHSAAAHMRLFISGSAPLLAETHREFAERTGKAILERYGMTETGMLTSNPYDGDRIAGTVGFPLPGVDLRIAEPETGTLLAQGEIGVIEVKGPNVFSGYWRMPEKTAAEFRPEGFFITGDMGSVDERGFVAIVGRARDLIITGGLNVYPKEVEGEIDALTGVAESAVIGLPHPDFGEAVAAVVVPAAADATSEEAILAALKDRLAGFKLPRRVVFVEELPRNTMGKVQKNALRDRYAKLLSG